MLRKLLFIMALLLPAAAFAQPLRPFACTTTVSSIAGPGVLSGFCAVPSGRVLVIENVNSLGTGDTLVTLEVQVTTDGTMRRFYYPVTSGPATSWFVAQTVALYADAGSNVVLIMHESGTGASTVTMSLSGHLE